ncbi:MAG: GxxExxY protein [Chloroflexi bacterium]|nr:GxxExxY protein [Chloroflexota bacterium]
MASLHPEIIGKIVSAFFDVHWFARSHSTYSEENLREALIVELTLSKVKVKKQVPVLRLYRDRTVGTDVIDLVVENVVAVQVVKAQELTTEHTDHMQSYLRDSGLVVGLVLRFGGSDHEFKYVFKDANLRRTR